MTHFIVLYHDDTLRVADSPLAFLCQADDVEHAEEQCQDANPSGEIRWVVEGKDVVGAYESYYASTFQ